MDLRCSEWNGSRHDFIFTGERVNERALKSFPYRRFFSFLFSFFSFFLLPSEREISNQNVKRSVESFAFKNYTLGVSRNSSLSRNLIRLRDQLFSSSMFLNKTKKKKSLLQFFTQTPAIANAKILQDWTITARNNDRATL